MVAAEQAGFGPGGSADVLGGGESRGWSLHGAISAVSAYNSPKGTGLEAMDTRPTRT